MADLMGMRVPSAWSVRDRLHGGPSEHAVLVDRSDNQVFISRKFENADSPWVVEVGDADMARGARREVPGRREAVEAAVEVARSNPGGLASAGATARRHENALPDDFDFGGGL